MKSMTDFIMEQEQPLYVEEAFDEAELVSSYMSLCAASANMMYMCECVTIVEFCESNDIPLPEKLIQEGWLADKFSKIWAKISEIFAKIADWFKGLVKGTATAFAKTKITEIIAKLRTYDGETAVSGDKATSLKFLGGMYYFILEVLDKFREAVLDPIAAISTASGSYADGVFGESKDDTTAKHIYFINIDNLISDLEFLSSTSKWKDANGTGINDWHTNLKLLKTNANITDERPIAMDNKTSITFKQVIGLLEKINRIDIPTKSGKLLKEIQKDEDAIKKYTPNTEKFSAGTKLSEIRTELNGIEGIREKDPSNNPVNNKYIKVIKDQLVKAKFGHDDGSGGTTTVDYNAAAPNDVLENDLTITLIKGTWTADPDTQKKVKTAADKLAKVYDNIMKAVVDVAELATKDIKKAEGEDETYKKELETANKDSNSESIGRRSELFKKK